MVPKSSPQRSRARTLLLPHALEHSAGRAVLANEAEQDVLGTDVVMAQRQRLPKRQLQHLLRARREGNLARRDLLARADDPDNLGAHTLHGDVQGLEDPRGEALLLTEETKEDVLGPDVIVLERPRLLLREDDHETGAFRELLEHVLSVLFWGCEHCRKRWRRRPLGLP